MRIQGISQARLMEESELCVLEAARYGTPVQMQVATRLITHPESYRRWEAEHAQLMIRVSSQNYLHRQAVALRATALTVLHRKAVFEYLQERQLTLAQRHKLMAMFHSLKEYSASLVVEHGNYLRGASSYWCSHHLARRLIKDGVFAEPLHLYEERYADYFRVHCDVELAETDEEKQAVEPMRMLQPLLKHQLAEARQEILSMPYSPEKVWREVEIRRPTGDTTRLRTLGSRTTERDKLKK
jgi:sugar diacid utilization regulator